MTQLAPAVEPLDAARRDRRRSTSTAVAPASRSSLESTSSAARRPTPPRSSGRNSPGCCCRRTRTGAHPSAAPTSAARRPSASPPARSRPDVLICQGPRCRATTAGHSVRTNAWGFGVISRPGSRRDRSVINRASRPRPPNFTPYGCTGAPARVSGSGADQGRRQRPVAQGCCAARASSELAARAAARRHEAGDRRAAGGSASTPNFQLPTSAFAQ